MKTISVIIPTYNRASTIERSIYSVLNQTYSDLELIVVDDGSTDNTKEIVNSIKDCRVRYIWQENAGACAARNRGIEEAKGEYIAFQDSDDEWHLDKLEKQMCVFTDSNPDVVFCHLHYIDNKGESVSIPNSIDSGFIGKDDSLFGIGTQSIIAKKAVFSKFLFDEDLPRFQDLEWLYRAREWFSIYCLNEDLVEYLVRDDSISKNSKALYEASKRILMLHPELPYINHNMANTFANLLLFAKKTQNKTHYIKLAKEYNSSFKFCFKCLLYVCSPKILMFFSKRDKN